MVYIEEVNYKEYGNCVRIFNETTELLVTVDLGPRVIRYGLIGKENFFCEASDEASMETTGWKIYGGHRLWHSPEHNPRSYEADNEPIDWEEIDNGIHVVGNVEPNTGMLKEMTIALADVGSEVGVVHTITNTNLWDIEFSAWALSVMAPGGKEVIPMSTKDTGLIHNRSMSLWPYTMMNDPRVTWGERYITLKQDPDNDSKFKLGITNDQEWAAYFNNNQAFVKRYMHFDAETYPDNGMSYETFTCDFMLEMESLSPLAKVGPGEAIGHLELWHITDNVEAPSDDDDDIDRVMKNVTIPGPEQPGNWYGEHHHHDSDCGCSDGGCGCGHDHDGEDCGCDDDCECQDKSDANEKDCCSDTSEKSCCC